MVYQYVSKPCFFPKFNNAQRNGQAACNWIGTISSGTIERLDECKKGDPRLR
jgi:hypothetical protein